MAKIQIENSVSQSKYQWSGEVLEKDLEEASGEEKNQQKLRTFLNLSPLIGENTLLSMSDLKLLILSFLVESIMLFFFFFPFFLHIDLGLIQIHNSHLSESTR
jgi:hypothetical protein